MSLRVCVQDLQTTVLFYLFLNRQMADIFNMAHLVFNRQASRGTNKDTYGYTGEKGAIPFVGIQSFNIEKMFAVFTNISQRQSCATGRNNLIGWVNRQWAEPKNLLGHYCQLGAIFLLLFTSTNNKLTDNGNNWPSMYLADPSALPMQSMRKSGSLR